MTDMFEPLASRMRPQSLEQYMGQSHLLGKGKALREALLQHKPHSMIFWGPPGTGKTSLAQLMAQHFQVRFESLSAVMAGIKEIRIITERALLHREAGEKTLLFVDEVHRFNKVQQDAFLPFIENGTLIFVGATTENPSFELNNALLSRCRVYVLKSLDEAALTQLVTAALTDKTRGLGQRHLSISADALTALVRSADGDARRLLNYLEILADFADIGAEISLENLDALLQDESRRFDKGGDYFYDQISALHKAVRGSAPDAALYWFCRMIDGGCDPLYLARRVLRMANEDIGNADPRAVQLALNAWDVQQRLGSPEGELALAQAIVYLACAPKSNAVYVAFNAAKKQVKNGASYEVPLHLRNAPTALMGSLGHGRDYRYAHDEAQAYVPGESYFPAELDGQRYYFPVNRGLEQKIAEKLQHLRQLDQGSDWRRYAETSEAGAQDAKNLTPES